MSDQKKAYSWDASLIGYEGDGPIEYPADEARIYAPVEDGQVNSNFSGQIFRELSERQRGGELGSEPNLRERPSRAGKGENFSLENEKKYKIGKSLKTAKMVAKILKRHSIKRVASRHLNGE